ncbi:MAG: threonine synthase [Burkholderiales bacterium]
MNYIDAATGATYPLDKPRWCGDGGSYLNLGDATGLTRGEIDTSRRSVWRYAKALLVDSADAVTLGEGWTPLICGKLDGFAVTMKLEFMMPTGSFKDRGMTTLITYLKNCGITRVLEDSSGNAGASMAAYAAAAGMQSRILVPETASYPKIAQMAATGADVVTIKGSRQDVADAALRYAKEMFYASHNWQPFFLEGTKTLAYELWEQLGFRIPDNIVFPVGYGSNVCGCERGFAELKRRGEIDRVPRLFGVQAANCAPYYNAFKAGVEELVPTDISATIAEGIASSKPTRVRDVLRAIRNSGGSLLAVTEEEIVSALGALARQGLYVEPTSASAAAGLRQLFRDNAIAPEQTTVLVLTGSGLKASEKIGQLLNVNARGE